MKIVLWSTIYSLVFLNSSCTPKRSSKVQANDVRAYDIAAEEAANDRAGNIFWVTNPRPNVILQALDERAPGKFTNTTIRIKYDSKSGRIDTEYGFSSSGNVQLGNHDLNLDPVFTWVSFKDGRNSAAPSVRLTNRFNNNGFVATITVALCFYLLVTAVFSVLPITNIIHNVKNYKIMKPIFKDNKLTPDGQLAFEMARTLELQKLIESLVRSTPNAAYLNTVMERKVTQLKAKAAILDALTAPASVTPLDIHSGDIRTDVLMAATIPSDDANHLPAAGTDFVVIKTREGIYKMTVYPGLAVGISFISSLTANIDAIGTAPATSDWEFRNTLSRTQLVAPMTDACRASCFDGGRKQEQWDNNNLTKFNIALALIKSKIPEEQLDANPKIKDMFIALNTAMADIIKPPVLTQGQSLANDQQADSADKDVKEALPMEDVPLAADDAGLEAFVALATGPGAETTTERSATTDEAGDSSAPPAADEADSSSSDGDGASSSAAAAEGSDAAKGR